MAIPRLGLPFMAEAVTTKERVPTFQSLRIRNFRLFFGGQLISQVGNWLTNIAQALLVLHITHNNGIAVGGLSACQYLPVLLLGSWTGLVADRHDKRTMLIIVQSCAMLQSFMLATLAFIGHPPLIAIYLVASIGGVCTSFDNPTRRSFVVEMVPEEYMQNAVSLNSALMTSARIFGPALAGLLVITVGFGWCFTIDGISYLAVLWGLWRMNTAEIRASKPTDKRKGQIREGYRYMRSVPDLFVPLVMMAIVGTLAFNLGTVLPLYTKKTFHGSDTTFTLLYSIVSIGSFVGALVSARRRTITVRSVANGAGLFGISMMGLVLAPTLHFAFPLGVFLGFASVVFMTASTAIVQVRADPAMRGRVLSLQAMVFLGSTPIGGPIMGTVCQLWGARYALLIGALGCFGSSAWGHFKVRQAAQAPEMVQAS
jgi:MFS family permease